MLKIIQTSIECIKMINLQTFRFLFDRLKRSTENSLTLSEKFVFSFLHKQSNFETTFHILYSAFQINLIENPGEFEYWIPESIDEYPESLEFITNDRTKKRSHSK